MIKRLVFVIAIASPALSWAQMVISSGTDFVAATGTTLVTTSTIDNQSLKTDFTNLKLVLAATGTAAQGLINRTVRPLSVDGITINSNATFAIGGEWLVQNELNFLNGKLAAEKLQAIPGKIGYKGAADLVGKSESYVNGRIFMLSSGIRTFPIGTSTGFFPAQLEIDAVDATAGVGMEVISTANDPGFAPVTGSVKEIFTDHFWELTAGTTGTLSALKPISLSSNGTTTFFDGTGDAIILEMNATNVQTNLGGAISSAFYTSTSPVSAKAKTFALAKSDKITVVVHKLITPDNDQINDVLVIEGLDSFPENEVTLLDRWGVPFMSKQRFANYTQPAGPAQAGVDYSKLAIGNYICVIKYKENGTDMSIRQMITVLK
jgi:hypothetical protein